jgi:hypothetical protein
VESTSTVEAQEQVNSASSRTKQHFELIENKFCTSVQVIGTTNVFVSSGTRIRHLYAGFFEGPVASIKRVIFFNGYLPQHDKVFLRLQIKLSPDLS